jgi:dolichyl-phosphate beta-glucosyltransferase
MPDPYLSIVIPAYNEARRIGRTLEEIQNYVHRYSFAVEVIVVDDGSADGTAKLVDGMPGVRTIRNERNRGKGYSVRRGILDARGEFILFTDADLSAPIEEADKLLEIMKAARADAVVGSRALRRELIGVHQSPFREWGGRFFNLLVRIFAGLDISDTQCGFKLFRRETTRRAFQLQRVERFGFDPEILFLIRHLGGKILEVPVRWNHNSETKVNYLLDSTHMTLDLVALRWRALMGEYETASEADQKAH